ncbi:unnamed protein product [Brassica napus]|uniref:(rape) hypothetical protein n=1 Tax=Brassica napus TaxID=3708 RepID=A0A816U5V6_BRANA|nr:unnamed protein product [Brassica napus]
MSREGSLTTVLCRFTATLPVEPTSGCRKTGHAVDYVQAYQPPKELSYQPTNSLFPSPGRPEFDIPLWFAPFKSYDTRSISFTRVNPSFIGISSFSPPLKVKLLSPAWILSSVDPLQRLYDPDPARLFPLQQRGVSCRLSLIGPGLYGLQSLTA